MKEVNEKSRKKVLKRRKFRSAPNLPIDERRVKGTDMILVSPEDIKKYKKETGKLIEDKAKKPTKKNAKKRSAKDFDKIVMEPIKSGTGHEEKKVSEDYQWLIKKNIIKLMGAAKEKAQKERAARKTETKTRPIEDTINQIKSDNRPVKLEPKRKNASKSARADRPKELKRDMILKRANATLPPRPKTLPLSKPNTGILPFNPEYLVHPTNNNMLIQSTPTPKRTGIQKLKSIFNVFKSAGEVAAPKPKKNKKLQPKETAQVQKKQPKKSNKIPEKINKKNATVESAKPKTKKKLSETDSPKNEVLTGGVKRSMKKSAENKLLYTVSA